MTKFALPLAATVALAGCGTINDAVRTPQLSPIGASVPHVAPASFPMPPPQQESYAPNSLWRAGARTFFNDQRASRVGDILTVKIQIDDNAAVSNNTQRSRKSASASGVTNFFGLEKSLRRLPFVPKALDNTALITGDGSTSTQGQGAVTRAEKIDLTIAAVVTQLLPNGNLVIDGSQQVLINAEMRELKVAGIIRPEDIGADNTIRHTQIAEARISYGGRGMISAVQKPAYGQAVADAVAPF
jgi:flagellar L-ring protein precursor FlgH